MASLVVQPYDMKSLKCSTVTFMYRLRELRRIGNVGSRLHDCFIVSSATDGIEVSRGWFDVLRERWALGCHVNVLSPVSERMSIHGESDVHVCIVSSDVDEMDFVSNSSLVMTSAVAERPFVLPPPRSWSLTTVNAMCGVMWEPPLRNLVPVSTSYGALDRAVGYLCAEVILWCELCGVIFVTLPQDRLRKYF